MADVAMNELRPDFSDRGRGETLVTLTKTEDQQGGPLGAVRFKDHNDAIQKHSSITPTCVSVRLPLNGQLYGYDVVIPQGRKIDVKETVITPRGNRIEIKIVRIGDFQLPA